MTDDPVIPELNCLGRKVKQDMEDRQIMTAGKSLLVFKRPYKNSSVPF